MIINRANLGLLTTGFKTLFNNAFAAAPSQWERVAMPVPSSTKQEIYAWLGAMPLFREWIGERVIQNLRQHDYTIRNRDFEVTIGVDRNDIEDDQYGVYTPMIQMLGQQAKTHPDELVFGLLKNAFATKGYDGQNFVDTDHPVIDAAGNEQSVSNTQAGALAPWFLLDTTKPIKPLIFQKRRDYTFVPMDRQDDEVVFSTKKFRYGVDARVNAGLALWQLAFGSQAALDINNYGAARSAMMEFKADGGKPLNIMPNLLVVPPSLDRAAREVVMVERLANGADNPYYKTAEILVVPWLA